MSKENQKYEKNEELFLFISNILDYIDDVFSNGFDRDIIHKATFLKTQLTHILNNQKIINGEISIENKKLDNIKKRFNKECEENHAKYGLFEETISTKEIKIIFENVKEIVSSLITMLGTEEIPGENENTKVIKYNHDYTIPGTDISFDETNQLLIVGKKSWPIKKVPVIANEDRKPGICKILFCMAYLGKDSLRNYDSSFEGACLQYKEKFGGSKNVNNRFEDYIRDINKTLLSIGSKYILNQVVRKKERKLEPK